MRTSCLSVLLVLFGLSAATQVSAESPKSTTVDTTGTWRWDFDYEGNVIKNLLTLQQNAKGKLRGTLEASDLELKISDASVKEGKVQFGIEFDMNGAAIRGKYVGKVTADQMDGEVTFSTDQGEQAFAWNAKRSLEPKSVVGTWVVETETPEGTVTSKMTVTEKNGKLSGRNEPAGQDPYEADVVMIESGKLVLESTTDYQGADLSLVLKATVLGDKMNGTIEYEIDGNSGTMPCKGTREKSKKKGAPKAK